MTINDNKEDLGWKKINLCHKSTSDGGALAMMCEREKEPQPGTATRWKVAMVCTNCKTTSRWARSPIHKGQVWHLNDESSTSFAQSMHDMILTRGKCHLMFLVD